MTQKRRKFLKTLYLLNNTKLLVFILITVGRGVSETVRCPRYCQCYLNPADKMRTVSCVDRKLDNIDLSVPKRVQNLDLSNNSISILEDRGFQSLGLIEIIKLVMRHNSIRTIGLHSFAGLTYLQWVDLTANNLYQILPWTFHENNNLKIISLSSNPLGHITSSGPILDVPSLEVLELSNCNFAYFSQDAFSALPNLRRLNLGNNQLIHFEIHTLQFLYNLEELDVSNNPWPCNTNLKTMKEILESKSSKLTGSSCDSPNKHVIEVKSAQFEKIISVGVVYPEYDDTNNSDSDEENAEESSIEQQKSCNNESGGTNIQLLQSDFVLSPKFLVLIAFQLGVCTTLFFGYCCIYFTNNKKKYHSLEAPVTVTPVLTEAQLPSELSLDSEDLTPDILICPETPPPSYRDLFIQSTP